MVAMEVITWTVEPDFLDPVLQMLTKGVIVGTSDLLG